ncbi:hypothetical protein V8G54_033099, partial [Vigna mungo]
QLLQYSSVNCFSSKPHSSSRTTPSSTVLYWILSYSPIMSSPSGSPSLTSSSSPAVPASLPSSLPKLFSSPTTPQPTSPSTTPVHPPRPLLHPLPRHPRHPVLPRLLSLRRWPPALALSPRRATPSTPSGTQVHPPPAPASMTSFCSPSSPSFFHYAKVFQSLLKGKGKKRTFGLQICFSFQREVFSEP